jgi:hypothetical protein
MAEVIGVLLKTCMDLFVAIQKQIKAYGWADHLSGNSC